MRNLKPLEESGLVIDISIEGSGNCQLKLTDKGVEAYRSAKQLWEKAQIFFEEYLGIDNINTLTAILSKIEALVP